MHPGQSHPIPYLTGQFFPSGGKANGRLVYDHPPTGVRRQADCCVSMRGNSSALSIFWARSFHYRPHRFPSGVIEVKSGLIQQFKKDFTLLSNWVVGVRKATSG